MRTRFVSSQSRKGKKPYTQVLGVFLSLFLTVTSLWATAVDLGLEAAT